MDSTEYTEQILASHPEYANAPFFLGMPFDDADNKIMEGVITSARAVSDFFGRSCEVVVHSLQDPLHSVLYAANSDLTQRKEGDPILLYGLQRICKIIEGNQSRVFFGQGITGIRLRAGVYPILNSRCRCLGSLSIGFNLETQLITFFQDFYDPKAFFEKNENYGPRIDVAQAVQEALGEVRRNREISRRSRIKEVIRILFEKKIFRLRNAVNIAAEELNSSPATIYWHLRQIKNNKEAVTGEDVRLFSKE